MLLIGLVQCKSAGDDKALTHLMQLLEKHIYNGDNDSIGLYLSKTAVHINPNSSFYPRYYLLKGVHEFADFEKVKSYADSALSFFNKESRIQDYPDLYAAVLMMKGENTFYRKMDGSALKYYFEALKYQKTDFNDSRAGSIFYKIGSVYFAQGRFTDAIDYYKQYIDVLQQLHHKDIVYFYNMQATLNNIGVSYERLKRYDSALLFYNTDLQHIKAFEDSSKTYGGLYTAAQLIALDNIGGVYLKTGKTDSAQKVIAEALAMPYYTPDGTKFTTFLKQAKIAGVQHNLPLQKSALDSIEYIIAHLLPGAKKILGAQTADYLLLKSEYYAAVGDVQQAYSYRNAYYAKKDSLEAGNFWIHRLNFEKELNNFEQFQHIQKLQFKNLLRAYLLYGFICMAVLLTVIAFLYRKQYQKSNLLQQLTETHNKRLKATLKNLELTNKQQLRVMRVMAHDLKTPVAGIAGLAEIMLEDENNTPEINEMLELMRKTGYNASNMINELLSSALNDDALLEKEKVNLVELIKDAVEVLRLKAEEKKQLLNWHAGSETIIASVNSQSIYRAVSNLVVNAIKFSATGKKIEVNIEEQTDNNRVLISVADSGIGIPEDEKEEVFQMFSSAKKPGTAGETPFGLGLSITKKIVERHYGKIWFTSEVNVGTTFYIELPIELKKLKNFTGHQFPASS